MGTGLRATFELNQLQPELNQSWLVNVTYFHRVSNIYCMRSYLVYLTLNIIFSVVCISVRFVFIGLEHYQTFTIGSMEPRKAQTRVEFGMIWSLLPILGNKWLMC